MALSGSFSKSVGAHWRVYCTWAGSQSISGNYTNITLRTYWETTQSYGEVRSTATKYGSASVNGSSGNFTFSAKLSGNQRKLVNTRTIKVIHNSDGSKSGVALSATLGVNVTLSGVYYGNMTASTTVTLDRIPRASSISSNANWTAGSNKTVTISRASTRFTHTVRWQVQDTGGTWRTIKTSTGVGTSVSSGFTTAQNKDIFNRMAQNGTRPSRIQIETFSGSTSIGGVVNKTGTVTAPSSSTVKITNPTGVSSASGQGKSTVYIDQNIQVSITRSNSNFTHKLIFKDGNDGSTIYTTTGVGTSHTWSPTTAHMNHMYGKIPNSIEFDGQIDIFTYYDGVQVRGRRITDINYRVRQSVSKPTFSASSISYLDTNSTITGITGNNQYIVQGQSQFRASINSSATAKNSATISSYEVKINGVTRSRKGTGVVDMGVVKASSNTTMTVTAIDSRGFKTTVSKAVNIVPYSPPTISARATRLNGFEDQTTIKISGKVSPIKIGTTNKNSISIARRRHKESTASTYGSWINLSASGIPNYTIANENIDFGNASAWNIQVQVTDIITTTTQSITVPVGAPILYLDSNLKSVGVGGFPQNEYELYVSGGVRSSQVYEATYSNAPNMYITNDGTFGRSTSASKYKLDISKPNTSELENSILDLEVKSWKDKSSVESWANYLTEKEKNPDLIEPDVGLLRSHYGLIAEDLVDAGLEMFVQYGGINEDGTHEVEGIEYDRLWVLLIPIIRDQKKKIEELELKILEMK